MAFPNIDIEKPEGTDLVSSVDDAIRDTRMWLREALLEISGYPDIGTVCIQTWTNATKPQPKQGKFLLGYNTDLKSLEVIGNSNEVVAIDKAVALLAHPVGSYYETSDPTFNPNTAWGGTWVEDSVGKFMLSGSKAGYSSAITETGGEEEHSLVRAELPIHYHPHRHPHTHQYNIEGSFMTQFTPQSGSEETVDGYLTLSETQTTGSIPVKFKTITGETGFVLPKQYVWKKVGTGQAAQYQWVAVSEPDYSLHGMVDADSSDDATEDMLMHVGSRYNNVTPPENLHNNMPPYKVCVRWHRIA